MTPKELQKWMDKHGKRPVDVASATHVSLDTVRRFLKGDTEPSNLTKAAIERMVEEHAKQPAQS